MCTCIKIGRERWTGEGHAPYCDVTAATDAGRKAAVHTTGGDAKSVVGGPTGCTCPKGWGKHADEQGHHEACALEIARVAGVQAAVFVAQD